MWLQELPGGAGLDVFLEARLRELKGEAEDLTSERMEAGEDAWVADAMERYRLTPLALTGDHAVEDSGPDMNIVLVVPFEGDVELWHHDPRDPDERFADDARRPFQGHVDPGEMVLRIVLRRKGEAGELGDLIEKGLDEIGWWVERSRSPVDSGNQRQRGRGRGCDPPRPVRRVLRTHHRRHPRRRTRDDAGPADIRELG